MKVKKLGHCCFVVEINNKRVMTDPGTYSSLQNEEHNIDIVVFTHEHQDHFHLESIKRIIENNPNVTIVTNSSVGKLLSEAGINFSVLEDGNNGEYGGVYLEAHGSKHSEIYNEFGLVQNTGYFIGKDLFYAGDSFVNPNKHVDILALPVSGPWMTIKTSINYALALKPRVCFPVHDGMIQTDKPGPIYRLPNTILNENGIAFKELVIGKEEEI